MSELGLLRYPMTITNDHQRDQLIESMRLLKASSAQPTAERLECPGCAPGVER